MRRLWPMLLLFGASGTPVLAAGIPDHLKCYKIKDPIILSGVLDVDTPQFGVDPGCTVSKAKLFCVPATKVVQSVQNKLTGPITPLPVVGAPTSDDRVCYKLKCPILPVDQLVTDQFGTRTLDLIKTSYVCTPAVKGTAYCGDGTVGGVEDCDDADLGGASCASEGFASGTLACTSSCTFDTSGCVSTTVPGCGNGAQEGAEQCDGGDLAGATCVTAGFASGTLACTSGCAFDTSACANPASEFPATGMTAVYLADKNDGIPGAVAVPDDGTLQTGAPLAYADNGDGTVTDLNTNLTWEKKGDNGGLHDKDNVYRWTGNGSQETIWDWLDDVNSEGGTGYAGHSDWRIPNAKELQSIVDYDASPAVSSSFNSGCAPGCSPVACSCTIPGVYWTSTSFVLGPSTGAWRVGFDAGGLIVGDKATFLDYVRAVRGGLP